MLLTALALGACALPGLNSTRPLPTRGPAQPAAAEPTRPPSGTAVSSAPPVSSAATAAPISLSFGDPEPVPPGFLEKVGVFQSGGGSGPNQANCTGQFGVASWCRSWNGSSVSIASDYRAIACGLPNQPVQANLVPPSGSTRPLEINGQPPACLEIRFTPGPTDPLGRYRVNLTQSGQTRLSDTFELVQPRQPSGTLYQGCVWLAGLPGGQNVRLLAFGLVEPSAIIPAMDASLETWRFIAERWLAASAGGQLLACPDLATQTRYPELVFLAMPSSGKAIPAGEASLLAQFQGSCASALTTRLAAGRKARLLNRAVPLFTSPALSGKAQTVVPAFSEVQILDGPACPAQGPWVWKVQPPSGPAGWLAESDAAEYFLEPVR